MSGGSPVGDGGGFVRERHNQDGYSSNGEEIEDDDDGDDTASSRGQISLAATASPSVSTGRARIEFMVNSLWIASAAFIVYLGDLRCNLVFLLFQDERIRRKGIVFLWNALSPDPALPKEQSAVTSVGSTSDLKECSGVPACLSHFLVPLCLGMIAIMLNFLFFFYTSTMAWRLRRFDEKWELTSISALPYITLLGLIAFSLLAFALWPIWSFLSIPLLFTLFMATMVVLPSTMIGILKRKNGGLRAD